MAWRGEGSGGSVVAVVECLFFFLCASLGYTFDKVFFVFRHYAVFRAVCHHDDEVCDEWFAKEAKAVDAVDAVDGEDVDCLVFGKAAFVDEEQGVGGDGVVGVDDFLHEHYHQHQDDAKHQTNPLACEEFCVPSEIKSY